VAIIAAEHSLIVARQCVKALTSLRHTLNFREPLCVHNARIHAGVGRSRYGFVIVKKDGCKTATLKHRVVSSDTV